MKLCKSIGCSSPINETDDFCSHCLFDSMTDETQSSKEKFPQPQSSSGSDNDYWLLRITAPKRVEPYDAECEDLIEALGMTFQEGEAFKAIWRKCKLRLGEGKPGDSELRNAEKIRHFGERMEVMEQRKAETCV